MKYSEIQALSLEELRERLQAENTSSQSLRFAHSISPLENPLRIKQSRKLIARLNTELRKRELEATSK
ncbi:MAG: 50S ribosomal protein L29 [Cytophagales bacterium CG18_big_fil_WC_8_21_14_2_50_42_9]|nr:MAG: 50S ribosomal protein L29 [Cytophagales bacterium CG18_big_fil_WC_8_21_14_2_50_42_9]